MATRRRTSAPKRFARRTQPARAFALRQAMGLTQDRFSRVIGIKPRTLSKLEKGEKPTDTVRRRLTEVERLQQALAEVIREDALGQWLDEPNDAFDGLKPIEVIERGQIDRLWGMLYDLRSGNPA